MFLFRSLLIIAQIPVLEHKGNVKIIELKSLNSGQRECNLSVSPDGETIYFMSTRIRHNSFDQADIYVSNFKDGIWSKPRALSSKINSMYGEDEPSIVDSGQSMYFQSWKAGWKDRGGPYYKSSLKNKQWESGIGLGGGISQFFQYNYELNNGFATDGMAISPDEKLFIVACGPDYDGNMDLYYSQRINGSWSYPKLFLASTPANERSVFIAADSKTIYFSSDGYGGNGGMDLFKTTFMNGELGEIINIGAPFNTNRDDMGFVVSGDGNTAFLIRDLDIYYADISPLDKKMKPLLNEIRTEIDTFLTKDQLSLKEGIVDSSESTSIENKKRDTTDLKHFIHFDFDSHKLNKNGLNILESLYSDLKNKSFEIILKGHTDSRGSNAYNEELSRRRISSVEKWLSKKGVVIHDSSSFGESQPRFPNNTAKHRQMNRRVELFIRIL